MFFSWFGSEMFWTFVFGFCFGYFLFVWVLILLILRWCWDAGRGGLQESTDARCLPPKHAMIPPDIGYSFALR